MSRKLFIHLGPSKTGTSAIQGFFRDNSSNTIIYPETGRWPDGSHHKLAFAFEGKNRHGLINIPSWTDLTTELEREIATSQKNVLISSEVSSVKFVKALIALLKQYKFEINLILSVRNPIERAASAYNQHVKDEVVGLTEMPDEFLLGRKTDFNFRPLYEKWLALNLPIIVIPYKSERPLIERFSSAVNAEVDLFHTEKRPNKSMGGAALIAILISNKLSKNEQQRRLFFDQIRQDSSFKIWGSGSFPFSDKAISDFYKTIQPDIDWIVGKFGFNECTLKATTQKRFILSKVDIHNIMQQLEKAGLTNKHELLIANTLKPFIGS
ncbi:hypothetical protein [Aliiglaciecola aliphaticivorans]